MITSNSVFSSTTGSSAFVDADETKDPTFVEEILESTPKVSSKKLDSLFYNVLKILYLMSIQKVIF